MANVNTNSLYDGRLASKNEITQDKGKGKATCSPDQVVVSKATLAQRARRERERSISELVPSDLLGNHNTAKVTKDKGKGKATHSPVREEIENENPNQMSPITNVVSKAALAQRARRERERSKLKLTPSDLLGQHNIAEVAKDKEKGKSTCSPFIRGNENENPNQESSLAQRERRERERATLQMVPLNSRSAPKKLPVPVLKSRLPMSRLSIMDDITNDGRPDDYLEHSVQLHQQSDDEVTPPTERDWNTLRIAEARAISTAKEKGKGKEDQQSSMAMAVENDEHEDNNTNGFGIVQSELGLQRASKRLRISHNSTINHLLPTTPAIRNYVGYERTPITTDIGESEHPPLDMHIARDLYDDFSSTIESVDVEVSHPMVQHVENGLHADVVVDGMNVPQQITSAIQPELSPVHHVPVLPVENMVHDNVEVDQRIPLPEARHSLGEMNIECPHCKALHWMYEKLVSSSENNPLFGICCLQGKIKLPLLNTPPPSIQELLEGNDMKSQSFRRYTREYNACHSFTSLGVKLDPRILAGRGPKTFVIHGELRHRTGSLLPGPEQEPMYAQLYIYDPDSALDIRCRRNPHLRNDVIEIIQETLLEHNPFPEKFRQAHAILAQQEHPAQHIPALLHYSSATDRRRYNLPTIDEIAVILPGDGTKVSGMRDIVLHLRGDNSLMRINECHPAYLPLHYVLMFPRGELGWDPSLTQWSVVHNRPTNVRLTQMQFYSYRLFARSTEYSTILRGGKLFQEFLVDAWASTEQNRLTYFRLNQDKLRAELYKDFMDVTVTHGVGPNEVGRPMILPSSHIGSARHMYEIFQDSMAITRYHHHPDIFLTMTANPKWTEIISTLNPHERPSDRPDLVARVFELKRKHLMKELERMKVFGKKNAHVYTIEFQKRGLPHMHLLIFLDGRDKIRVCSQVDKLVSAEFPDPDEDPQLFETVLNCMVHGPCGSRNRDAPCMDNGKCTKGYPKHFNETTTMGTDGYALYRRSNNGRVYKRRGEEFDNRDVVPYSPYLSKMFNCHINVEVCAGLRCVKYIHKYIYKGGDRATMILGGADEIQQYLEGRYIGPPEAAWRLFGFSLHEEIPSVIRLALHLPGMHQVNFDPNEPIENIVARIGCQVSTLTGFFAYYASNSDAPKFTYQEFPQHFVWRDKLWAPRQRGFSIGRIYFASPNSGERFYLRLLLTHVKGPSSYECLRTVNGVLYPSFKSTCVAKGLVEDDQEWAECLHEAAVMQTGYQLRRLFATILTQCSPVHPYELWRKFSEHICDDLDHKISTHFAICDPTPAQVEDYGLFLLNQLLLESGRSLSDYPPMPEPIGTWNAVIGNRLIWEHRQLQISAQQENVDLRVANLNQAQHLAYTEVCSSLLQKKGTTFFLNGGAGTGKTYLYNTITLKCRSIGHTVITVASSGIASLLLVGGRTAHSTFCIPLDVHDESICSFTKQSIQAELFRQTDLIIWDEVPMQHRNCVEAVDRSLRDIRGNNKPFGGMTVVLGGDFRQVLPVVPKGVREQIVSATLRRSVIWNTMHVLTLDVNMRLMNDAQHVNFVNFLQEIGSNPEKNVTIPSSIHKCRDLGELVNRIYPQLGVMGTMSPSFLTERTILSSKNDDVDFINKLALDVFCGEKRSYLAADSISYDDESNRIITNQYPNEFLNSLDPPGLPPFKLDLKVGCPIMLLRNIAPNDGLCNGTRLVIVRCGSRILEAQILTGEKAGNLVFIPRISLTPSSGELPFHMTRRQFPVRLTFSMTINKSQGQSVKFVGIDLRDPVFSHGQLYVALSRCTSTDRISCLLSTNGSSSTTNIVYPEVLLQ